MRPPSTAVYPTRDIASRVPTGETPSTVAKRKESQEEKYRGQKQASIDNSQHHITARCVSITLGIPNTPRPDPACPPHAPHVNTRGQHFPQQTDVRTLGNRTNLSFFP